MATVKILSLDGGTRPLLACTLVKRLLAADPHLLDDVDIFAGTSAGAITAALIAAAPTVAEGIDRSIALWQTWRPFDGVGPLSARTLLALSGGCAFLTHEGLYEELRELFGEMRISDLRRRVVIPMMSLDNQVVLKKRRHWSIEIAHNLEEEEGMRSPSLADVVLRSSSIPVLHPAFQGHVDGGLFANNPSMCALATARDFLGARIEDILVLSVGQGLSNNYMALSKGDVGYGKWLLDPDNPMALIKLVMDANLQSTNYQISRILEDRFVRLDPLLSAALEPSPGLAQGEFDAYQVDMATAVDLSPTLEQLAEINWIQAVPQPVSDV
ncbi:patatin-like phospholipase family protein [Chelatococcus reniformis]|uniref:PNPLA domain-containing protein n=1 Tax=Chelatococcus reniformis TaxID=1494448 RepID=A0A916X8C1_9HYPH|nr:patatin-like phospholipase family protein [Chelatococcus reniformis]GGC48639.1 hypothetical protein GCM10010994_04780 [Chelatococcus reniformis]